jgi:2-oxo-4-hydroxy-4-carboxy-5-ureidoimidazoline decarboxylase
MMLAELNNAPPETARRALSACCGSGAWVERMISMRPFGDSSWLHDAAQITWISLPASDWLEAFSKHPKIGETSPSSWSRQEQQSMSNATALTAASIRELNEQYFTKFGWIFIICATGKSADEMHSALQQRLHNDADTELPIAAAEQARIMHLRLDKLLSA